LLPFATEKHIFRTVASLLKTSKCEMWTQRGEGVEEAGCTVRGTEFIIIIIIIIHIPYFTAV
jgi:hypothetical protein